MIQLPRRSVTRFFIPLIDVMTVLFCIFLLMPIFNEGQRDTEDGLPPVADSVRQDLDRERLARQLSEARQRLERLRQEQSPLTREERAELERLRREKGQPLAQRYAVFVLGIDAKNGQLFYLDPDQADQKQVVAGEPDARRLIEKERKAAGGREL